MSAGLDPVVRRPPPPRAVRVIVRATDFDVYFKLLAAVAAADGVIDEREVRKLAQLLRLEGHSPMKAEELCMEAVANQERPLWFLTDVSVTPELAKRCLRDGFLIAFVDQNTAESELEVLHHASVLMGNEADFERIAAMSGGSQSTEAPADSAGSPEHAELHLRLLAAVVAADGVIENEERVQLRKVVRVLGFDPRRASRLCDEALERREDPLWFIPSTPPETELIERMLRDCALIVGSRGTLGRAERKVLDAAARQLGVATPTRALDDVEKALREGLQDLDALTDSLLRVQIPPPLIMAAGVVAGVAPMMLMRDQVGTMNGFIYIGVLFAVAMIGTAYLNLSD